MKKIYSMLACAVALSASATVAPANQSKAISASRTNALTSDMIELSDASVISEEGMMKAPAQPDLNGLYQVGFYGRTQNENGRQMRILKMEKVSDRKVKVYGLFFFFPIEGNYDPSTMTISFSQQQVAAPGEFDQTEPINFYPKQLVVGSDDKISGEIDKDSYKLTYKPNGVEFQDGTTGFVGSWVYENNLDEMVFNKPSNLTGNSGFLTGWKYGVTFDNLTDAYPLAPEFTYNESEWNYIGDSEFNDGWFATVYAQPVPAWKVKTMQSKTNKDHYLLVNPYGKTAPAQITEINERVNEAGYIYLDCSEPEMVVVRPNILSGFASSELFYTNIPMICTSVESVEYAINETSKEDIIEDASIFEDPLPVLKDGVVTIPNCVYQMPSDYFYGTDGTWVDTQTKQPVEMTTVIKLPMGAVEGIIADAENAPARYFNLQGMEVANPEAGQLVIKKEGSKTTKMIVR